MNKDELIKKLKKYNLIRTLLFVLIYSLILSITASLTFNFLDLKRAISITSSIALTSPVFILDLILFLDSKTKNLINEFKKMDQKEKEVYISKKRHDYNNLPSFILTDVEYFDLQEEKLNKKFNGYPYVIFDIIRYLSLIFFDITSIFINELSIYLFIFILLVFMCLFIYSNLFEKDMKKIGIIYSLSPIISYIISFLSIYYFINETNKLFLNIIMGISTIVLSSIFIFLTFIINKNINMKLIIKNFAEALKEDIRLEPNLIDSFYLKNSYLANVYLIDRDYYVRIYTTINTKFGAYEQIVYKSDKLDSILEVSNLIIEELSKYEKY
jgi:uncharacterized membrane protein (GlpM family)